MRENNGSINMPSNLLSPNPDRRHTIPAQTPQPTKKTTKAQSPLFTGSTAFLKKAQRSHEAKSQLR